jgi:predicted nuclease of predicted toxin-antitoxin system
VKIKVDENLPSRLVVGLRGLGHDVETVAAEGLAGRPDQEVWLAAGARGVSL